MMLLFSFMGSPGIILGAIGSILEMLVVRQPFALLEQ